ncbi:hypothetical protein DAEQUDRAFT_771028 [Daedalea quercina L-15889]|uniref:Uncharacterized protein n=1 Tax=Daedalea quercina L-15889 TaxID=1314783 RepID=A0A165KEF0_9APHY|nr:hypothetical protein DAEQUDRAFT_771028 [Daedalea quercina L-15889]
MSNPGLHRAPGELPAGISWFLQVHCARFGMVGNKMLTSMPSAITSIYKLFPELQTLVLKGHMSPDLCQLLEPLTLESVFLAARTAGVLAPHLKHLVLLRDWHFCKVVEALKSLIPRQQDAHMPFKRLTLQKPYGPLPLCCLPFDKKVTKLLEAGLECELLPTKVLNCYQFSC